MEPWKDDILCGRKPSLSRWRPCWHPAPHRDSKGGHTKSRGRVRWGDKPNDSGVMLLLRSPVLSTGTELALAAAFDSHH